MSGRSVIIKGDNAATVAVDGRTSSLLITGYPDVALNAGTAYWASATKAAVPQNDFLDILFKVPANVLVYALASGGAASDALIEFYENPVTTADGTPLNEVARNRRDPVANVCTTFQDPTVTSPGDLLISIIVGGGGAYRTNGSSFSTDDEFILSETTNYLVRITNLVPTAAAVSAIISWFEFTDPAELRVSNL